MEHIDLNSHLQRYIFSCVFFALMPFVCAIPVVAAWVVVMTAPVRGAGTSVVVAPMTGSVMAASVMSPLCVTKGGDGNE